MEQAVWTIGLGIAGILESRFMLVIRKTRTRQVYVERVVAQHAEANPPSMRDHLDISIITLKMIVIVLTAHW